jgi:aspartyl-tRNA(Asn)/glutamyl-tRNA(Gln) amidotransferase subunit C
MSQSQSSSLSIDDVRRIARLARLSLSAEEEQLFQGQLSAILGYVEQLKALDVAGIEPMTHALAAGDAPPLRDDVVQPSLEPDEALANAPAREGTYFKVPRVIE